MFETDEKCAMKRVASASRINDSDLKSRDMALRVRGHDETAGLAVGDDDRRIAIPPQQLRRRRERFGLTGQTRRQRIARDEIIGQPKNFVCRWRA